MKPITIKDAEITICGLTFIVDYKYFVGCPATLYTPAETEEVEILRTAVKNQPEADADTLLEAIKMGMNIDFDDIIRYENGYDLLEQYIIENPPL